MELPTQLTGAVPHITVSMSHAFGDQWKPLRCSICGNIVCEYNENNIRSITASGEPQLDRPGKVIQCTGIFPLYGSDNREVFDLMFEMFEAVLHKNNLEEIRAIAIQLAKDTQEKRNTRCKAKYWLG